MSSIGLLKLREELHNRILVFRSIETILLRPQFERLWDDSTPEQKEACKKLIDSANKEGLLLWMREHPSISIEEMTIRQLMSVAQKHGIKNYSRLSKEELIVAIQRVEATSGAQ